MTNTADSDKRVLKMKSHQARKTYGEFSAIDYTHLEGGARNIKVEGFTLIGTPKRLCSGFKTNGRTFSTMAVLPRIVISNEKYRDCRSLAMCFSMKKVAVS
jgi:hypothetical protein